MVYIRVGKINHSSEAKLKIKLLRLKVKTLLFAMVSFEHGEQWRYLTCITEQALVQFGSSESLNSRGGGCNRGEVRGTRSGSKVWSLTKLVMLAFLANRLKNYSFQEWGTVVSEEYLFTVTTVM